VFVDSNEQSDQKIAKFFGLMWKHPDRACRCNKEGNGILLKLRKEGYKRPWWDELEAERVSFSFPDTSKTPTH
jgi:hypothetical protein